MASQIHFFTDIDRLNTQTANAYGPTQANPQTEYRTTSIHTASADCNAYAVCDGSILIQENASDSSLVNVILKPKNQGSVSFLNVKYFIYRGILKSSLIDSTDSTIVAAAGATNTLTKSVWDTQNKINQSFANANGTTNTNDKPSSKTLGIAFSTGYSDAKANTELIDSIFFNTAYNFKPPVVSAGMNIGTFKATGFGFEIMVHSIGFNPTLGLVRNSENIITATVLGGSPTQLQVIQNNSAREKILNYIDPCAYYGLHFNSKVVVHYSSGNETKKHGNSIYDDVLSKFINKDKVYIDIRNENGYSFNYYNNYGDNINASFDSSVGVSSTNYSTNGWPIKIVSNSDFASGNSSSKNIVRLSFPQGDNTKPLVFMSHAQLYNKYPREPKNKNKFVPLTFTSGFSDEIKIASPNKSGGSTTSSSWYIKLYYIKRNDPAATPGNTLVVPTNHHFDNLFSPTALPTFWDNTDTVKYISGLHEKYLDAESELGFAAMVETGFAKDQGRIIHFAYPTHVHITQTKRADVFKRILGASSEKTSFFDAIKNILPKLTLYKKKLHLSPDKYYLKYSEDGIENVKENFFGICLTTTEHQSLATAVASVDPNFHIPFITKKTLTINSDTVNNAYYEFGIALSGVDSSGNSYSSSALVTAYSGDSLFISSDGAATLENVQAIDDKDELKFDEKFRDKYVTRISSYNSFNTWNIYDENGTQVIFAGTDKDYLGSSLNGQPIILPVGIRVIKLGQKPLLINSVVIHCWKIAFWYQSDYREGYINKLALINSDNYGRVNYQDTLSIQNDVIVENFLNDAKFDIRNITEIIGVNSTDIQFTNFVTDTKNKLDTFINTYKLAKINNDTTTLNSIYSKFSILIKKEISEPVNNLVNMVHFSSSSIIDKFSTFDKFLEFDFSNPTSANKLLMPPFLGQPPKRIFVVGLTEDWLNECLDISVDGDFNLNQSLISTIKGDINNNSGSVYVKTGTDFSTLRECYNKLKALQIQNPTHAFLNNEISQKLLSYSGNLFDSNLEDIIIIGESLWSKIQYKSDSSFYGKNWAEEIIIDCSFGYIDSNNIFSVLVHEMKETSGLLYFTTSQSHSQGTALNERLSKTTWKYVIENGLQNFITSSLPNDIKGADKPTEIRNFFQRNSIIGVIYLNVYLKYL